MSQGKVRSKVAAALGFQGAENEKVTAIMGLRTKMTGTEDMKDTETVTKLKKAERPYSFICHFPSYIQR